MNSVESIEVAKIAEISKDTDHKFDKKKKKPKGKSTEVIIRGKPKSGRIWKNERTRFSSVVKTKGIKKPLQRQMALRNDLKRIKEISRAIVAEKNEQNEKKKERRRQNLKRQEENRKKSEIVQVIRNPLKIKRMKKKQLKMIEKRDTTNM